MKRLAIIGSGDLGQQIAYHALNDGHFEPIGFFDDFEDKNTFKHGLRVLGKISDAIESFEKNEFDVIIIALGYHHFHAKEEIFNTLKDVIPFGSIIHSSAYIDKSCKIGKGVFIYPGCVLDMNVEVKDNAVLNVGCIIAHDSIIGKHSFLSPSVKLAGFVKVGQKVSLGIGTIVIDNIKITNNVKTGGGAVVIKNIEESGLYLGIPAILKMEI